MLYTIKCAVEHPRPARQTHIVSLPCLLYFFSPSSTYSRKTWGIWCGAVHMVYAKPTWYAGGDAATLRLFEVLLRTAIVHVTPHPPPPSCLRCSLDYMKSPPSVKARLQSPSHRLKAGRLRAQECAVYECSARPWQNQMRVHMHVE